jgi:hypothetical protein
MRPSAETKDTPETCWLHAYSFLYPRPHCGSEARGLILHSYKQNGGSLQIGGPSLHLERMQRITELISRASSCLANKSDSGPASDH